MGAGALLDLVTVQKPAADPPVNAFGEVEQHSADAWETHASEWAEVQPTGGDELGQKTQQVAVRRWALRVRFHSGTQAITPLMRVVLPGGETLNITRAGDPDRKRRWIELTAEERV